MSNDRSDLQEISLRIKYESFAKLSTQLGTALNFQDAVNVLQVHLKYLFDFTSFRFLIFYNEERFLFEINRHSSQFNCVSEITALEREIQERNITTLLTEKELEQRAEELPPFFRLPEVKHVCFYPIRANTSQHMLIVAASKGRPPADADYRFLRLLGEFVLSKFSQLILNEQLEEMVKHRTEQLNKVNQELSTLFYHASHDFNAPLTTLLGLIRLCQLQKESPAELSLLFDRVNHVIAQAQLMLHKLKVISETETLVQEIETIDLHRFLDHLANKFSFAAKGKHIRLITEVAGHDHTRFVEEILSALLENLVENSIQYHRPVENAYVKISLESIPSFLLIVVEDNGQGIHPERQKFIFEMYSRGNEFSKGNGLGLYLVKKIVEKLNGTVSVESKLGKGSRFELRIPL